MPEFRSFVASEASATGDPEQHRANSRINSVLTETRNANLEYIHQSRKDREKIYREDPTLDWISGSVWHLRYLLRTLEKGAVALEHDKNQRAHRVWSLQERLLP